MANLELDLISKWVIKRNDQSSLEPRYSPVEKTRIVAVKLMNWQFSERPFLLTIEKPILKK